jgi:hypothetical protein
MAYLVLSIYAIQERWTTPWTWPARPPHDPGAAICAAVVFAAGTLAVATCGARDPSRK